MFTQESIIEKFKEKHGDFYDYSLVDYTGDHQHVDIICPKHGIFSVQARGHKSGSRCKKCALRFNTEKVVKQFEEVHGDFYDYSLVDYVRMWELVKIICPKHGQFYQFPVNHKLGKGCSACANVKRDHKKYKNRRTILYYVYFPEHQLYKIGITLTTVENRFKKDGEFVILSEQVYTDGLEALNEEQKLLNIYSESSYDYHKFGNVIGAGNSEMFVEDVLNLDLRLL